MNKRGKLPASSFYPMINALKTTNTGDGRVTGRDRLIIKEGLSEDVTYEQSPEWKEGERKGKIRTFG